MTKPTISTAVLAACLLVLASVAQAAEIRVLASNGVKAAMEALEPQFERVSGDTLTIEFSTAATLKQRIESGAAFDVAILTDEVVNDLIKSGKLAPATRAELAAVGIGVGFRKGTAKPDVRTVAAIKQALQKATSIAYTRDGASRPAIDKMIASLGVAHDLESKSHLVAAGQAPTSVAKGESELVLTLISEILPEEGVELAGPLPSEFQAYLGFAAASGTKTGNTPAAQALIKFLDGPSAIAVYKAKGMEAR